MEQVNLIIIKLITFHCTDAKFKFKLKNEVKLKTKCLFFII